MARRLLTIACALLLVLLPAATAGADEGETAARDQVHDIVFPVIGEVHYTDTYDAPRGGGRTHHATDIMGAKMYELVAPADGEVTSITIPEASWGYMLRITADDGWVYSYVHINNDTPGTDDGNADLSDVYGPGIEDGARVQAGQLVAYMGDSGNAEHTGAHLHFEMRDPSGAQVNPYQSLQQATVLDAAVGGGEGDPDDGAVDDAGDAVGESTIPRLAGADRVGTAVEVSAAGWPDGSDRAVLASGLDYAEALPASVLAGELDAPMLLVTGATLPDAVAAELERLGARSVTVVGSVDPAVDDVLASHGLVVDRLGSPGELRATSVAVAEAIGAADGVALLVNHERFADGISGAGLAAGRGWPILLSEERYVFQESVDAWRSLGIETLYLIGGSGVIGENIEAFVADEGIEVVRLAGPHRYATSMAVAEENEVVGGRASGTVLFATGTDHPDALAAGALAHRIAGQVLLVPGDHASGDGGVGEWVRPRAGTFADPRILGGVAAVDDGVALAIEDWLRR